MSSFFYDLDKLLDFIQNPAPFYKTFVHKFQGFLHHVHSCSGPPILIPEC